MPIKQVLDARVPIKVWTDFVEPSALEQLKNTAALPFVFKHVAVMPDVHLGTGATVGSVVATKGAIAPAAVGVDIGCGMAAVQIKGIASKDLGDNLSELRHSIERSIPVGFNANKEVKEAAGWSGWGGFTLLPEKLQGQMKNAGCQLGTLGGGNHFIEICLDTNDGVWVMLHSGSRHIGKAIADVYIDQAKGLMRQMFISLPDPDLAYLAQGTEAFTNYLRDLQWAQAYAFENRRIMLERVLKDLRFYLKRDVLEMGEVVNCHHNFARWENHFGDNVVVTRKGAVHAGLGAMGIIPGSMGTRSYIVRGLGNADSYNSCSHGAGRRMSRNEARKTFTEKDFEEQTAGVECKKGRDFIDEIPGAYKNIDDVMANQNDLVEIVATLKQVLCVKG